MKRSILIYLIYLAAFSAHAQQSDIAGEKRPPVAAADTIKKDTTQQKKVTLGQEIENDLADFKNRVINSGKEVKTNTVTQLKKVSNLATGIKGTATDSTGAAGKLITAESEKKLTAIKGEAAETGKNAKENLQGQIKTVTNAPATVKGQLSAENGKQTARELANKSVDDSGVGQIKQLKTEVRNEGAALKQEALGIKHQLVSENIPDSADLKKSSEHYRTVLEEKAMNLEYNSDDPENAPWKKNPLSKDDIGDLNLSTTLPTLDGASVENKLGQYKDKVQQIKSPEVNKDAVTAMSGSVKSKIDNNPIANFLDSITSAADKLDADFLKEQLVGAKKIYSEKFISRLYDSLGIDEANKIIQSASTLLKTEAPKDEFLKKINAKISGKEMQGLGYDAEKQSLKMEDAEKLNSIEKDFTDADLSGLKTGDLSKIKLPAAVLSELPPLSASMIDSKYLPLIDSMKDVVLKAKDYKLDEKRVTEEIKRAVVQKKPSFLDRSYLEAIVGFFADSTVNIFQASPSWGYHFTGFLSAGLGPNLNVQLEQRKKINLQAGFRSFIKAEVWKQRLYFQVEDNVSPMRLDKEAIKKYDRLNHQFLGGGGALLPISKSLAINFSVLYRLNKDIANPDRSPWVVRVGLSSNKKKS